MKTILLLTLSNVFMTFARSAHLKDLCDKIAGSEDRKEPLRLDFVWAGLRPVGARSRAPNFAPGEIVMSRQPLAGGA